MNNLRNSTTTSLSIRLSLHSGIYLKVTVWEAFRCSLPYCPHLQQGSKVSTCNIYTVNIYLLHFSNIMEGWWNISLESSSEKNTLCKSATEMPVGVRTVRKERYQNFFSHSIWTSCSQQRQTFAVVLPSASVIPSSLSHFLSLHLALLCRSSPKFICNFIVAFSLLRNLSSLMKLCIQVVVHAWSLYTGWSSPDWVGCVFPFVLAAKTSFTSESIIGLTRTTPYPPWLWITFLTMVTLGMS